MRYAGQIWQRMVWQGLKPGSFSRFIGPAKAVPLLQSTPGEFFRSLEARLILLIFLARG